jgi:hypothetical protein
MHAALKYVGVLGSCAVVAVSLTLVGESPAQSANDKYTVAVPGGLSFSEFKGYEGWQVVALSQNERAVAAILANPAMIEAYAAGIPGNGKRFPDGAKMAKIHWAPKKNQFFPDTTLKNYRRGMSLPRVP